MNIKLFFLSLLLVISCSKPVVIKHSEFKDPYPDCSWCSVVVQLCKLQQTETWVKCDPDFSSAGGCLCKGIDGIETAVPGIWKFHNNQATAA